MTREERDKAIRILQWLHDNKFLFRSTEEDVKYATKLAIQVLLQEPSGDAVSRKQALSSAKYIYESDSKMKAFSMIKMLEELPPVKLQESRWIPVSERLPEKNMACLVAVGRFNYTQIAVCSDLMGTIDRQIFYQGDVGHDNFKNITQYVKAWMPLPKPYKGEQE